MDEEISIIDNNTRNEKLKNFFINNRKIFVIGISVIFIALVSYFTFNEVRQNKKNKLADQFNSIIINFTDVEKQKSVNELIDIIKKKDVTYSPLALYFLLDNNLIKDNNQINGLFNQVIKETALDNEIKNLIIYKKALFNSEFSSENDLLQILNPVINSESIWKSHALYLLAEYFYAKDETQKAKEFFNQILTLPNSNKDIKLESQKRLTRDFGE